jgi:tRNA pseudouridine13 synthase
MNNPATSLARPSHMDSLAFAYQAPSVCAQLRCNAEDFRVQEILSMEPSANGGHAYLYIQKCQLTTEELTKKIARFVNTSPRHIGYAGLKDRNAVTSQWFSVDLCGKPEPDWRKLESDRITVLKTSRHERKLKQGAVKTNLFHLTLRNMQGDLAHLEERLSQVQYRGVPNYFGEQRFGNEENNLSAAYQMFTSGRKVNNRHLRGLYYSAARSYLFNLVLSYRVRMDCWDQAVAGDAMILDGSRSFFVAEVIDEAIRQRLQTGDIHPSGPLWGKCELASQGDARAIELYALQDYREWQQGLEAHGLESQRRALRLLVKDFQWEFTDQDVLHLDFALPSGAYATSVVRELVTQQ